MTDQGRSFDTVRIDALICGPGFQERMKEQRVIEIAERIASGRDVSTPIVRASDMSVIAGEDVVAAFCLLDGLELEVELVHDGSFDDELPTEVAPDSETRYGLGVAAAVAERTELTPVPLAIARALGEVVRSVIADKPTPVLGAFAPVEPGPDTWCDDGERVEAVKAAQDGTAKAAIAAVAAETGRTEAAVKKAANRARRAKDKVDIQCWGRAQPEAWLAATSELRRTMTNASNAIRTAMSALSPLLGGPLVPCVDLPGTYEELKTRASKLRDARPACVCAWCKNEPELRGRCVACGGRGWLGELAMSRVPKELFPAGSAMAQGRAVELPESPYIGADATPLESRSHTVESATKEQAESAWNALEEANGGEAFLDDSVFENVADDGDVW